MSVILRDYLAVCAVALVTVLAVTPVTAWFARLVGAVAEPGERRVHARPTPQLGGLALFAGVLAAVAAASVLPTFSEVFATTSEPEAIVLASCVIAAVGLVDDVRGISPPAKLAGQILAGGLLALFGVLLRFAWLPGNPGTVVSLGFDLAVLVTVVLIVAMMNAVNLIDGLDGLAAGIVAIAAVALLAYAEFAQSVKLDVPSAAPLILAAVAGVCVGFLVYNFHPASVFMGDTGSMLLGLLVGSAGISATGSIVQPSGSDFAAASVPVLVPMLVLAIPFSDTIWTILRRVRTGRAVFSPDKQHLHHRLVEIGHSHRRAVLIMYYWSALVAFGGVAVSILPGRTVVTVLGAGVALAVLFAVVPRVARWRRRASGGSPKGTSEDPNIVLSFTKSPGEPAKGHVDQRKRANGEL